MKRFEGKTILITGGNSGIGFATAKRIVSEGGRVMITGRDEKTLRQAVTELGSMAEGLRADVSSLAGVEAMYQAVRSKYGQIDGVFANAGIAKFGSTMELNEGDFNSMFDTNVKGLFFTLQKAIPVLRDGSSLVVNASVAASRGSLGMSIYGATKAAARSLVRAFANEHIARGIRFNAVSPGPIETPIWTRDTGPLSPAEARDLMSKKAASNPMKRFGTPDEVAAAVAFLLSSESSYTTGSEVFVDGGVNQI